MVLQITTRPEVESLPGIGNPIVRAIRQVHPDQPIEWLFHQFETAAAKSTSLPNVWLFQAFMEDKPVVIKGLNHILRSLADMVDEDQRQDYIASYRQWLKTQQQLTESQVKPELINLTLRKIEDIPAVELPTEFLFKTANRFSKELFRRVGIMAEVK